MKKSFFIFVLALSIIVLSAVDIGAAVITREYQYNGTAPNNGLFDYKSLVPVTWEYETGKYVFANQPEKLSPKSTLINYYYLYKHYAVPITDYKVQYKIRTEHYNVISGIHLYQEDIYYKEFLSPGAQ